ncbi:DUF3168 domain-containing protein [Ectobacillus ponti]|uniref:DUF3168 domain-containing protein n=1 Tax=Ectobacillus ponti TaxID=2961894 RepID=A0AA41X9N6_9BACI|nr:DUF3168 domain-containing protein [Ectobacillus ponti]MCP8969723.1 DUF3168 domain-containing protein [Ectobacillus ponti]
MLFEEALRAELSALDGLNNKVFPLNATEGTAPPFVVYVSNNGVQDKTLSGYLSTREVECEINIIHGTYSSMKALSQQVLEKILSFQGRIIGGQNGILIRNVTYHSPVELYESEILCYRSVLEVKFRF